VFYTTAVHSSSSGPPQRPTAADTAGAAASAALPPPPRRLTRPQSRQAARRPGLTVDQVVAAAVSVLDEGGVAGLSMRKVAERLGTGAATLYAYVSGRDELLELVFDELIGTVPLPEPDPERWREQVVTMMGDLRTVLTSHRDAALASLGRIPTSPNTLAAAESLVAVLRAGGLSDRAIGLGVDVLILYVSASTFEDSLLDQSMGADEVQAYHQGIHDFYAALPADRFPMLASLGDHMTGPDGDERFDFGLEVIIAGLEAVSAPAAARS
jgi:AcrR family transcriptional regulator